MNPPVTIGVPTYCRSQLLARALQSIASQDYRNIQVIVADNASAGTDNERIVASFKDRIAHLSFHKHQENIGALANFFFLLNAADGKYFMWLADDDEISPNYVSHLVALLERHPGASSAAGHWHLKRNEVEGTVMPTSHYPQRSALGRALKYVWSSDDAFFYSVHRTELLRQATFSGYVWPNRNVYLNWAYVYLLDMVLRGQILLATDPSVQFINHDYTAKSYAVTQRSFRGLFMHLCRRVNVHVLYWYKCARYLSAPATALVVPVSVASLLMEHARALVKQLRPVQEHA